MASSSSSSSHAMITLSTFLLFILISVHGKTAPVAPGPTPAPLNVTAILEKGGQYTTLLRLLTQTQVGEQLQNQLNNSFDGLTLFAPTDNAFNNLKTGTLNGLTTQEQVALVLYHVLPRFYSLTTFSTTSNPVRTQASGNNGVYTVNVTSTSQQVNISTGVNDTPINNALYSTYPLAVYSVDQVLLPYDLFGAKPPAAAPAPAADLTPGKPKKKAPKAEGPDTQAADSTTPSTAAGLEPESYRIGFRSGSVRVELGRVGFRYGLHMFGSGSGLDTIRSKPDVLSPLLIWSHT